MGQCQPRSFHMTKSCTLIVSTLPPKRCGIARYAGQLMGKTMADGTQVRTMALDADGTETADIKLNFANPIEWKDVFFQVARYKIDAVYLNYTHNFFPAGSHGLNLFVFSILLFFLAFKAREFSVIVHEFKGATGKSRQQRLVDFAIFRSSTQLLFHTNHERQEFLKIHGSALDAKSGLVRHEAQFEKCYIQDKPVARKELGLAAEGIVFLCAGFFQHHKGFDIAIDQFVNSGSQASLRIVGSMRTEGADIATCRDVLFGKTFSAPADIELVEEYVSDEAFDRWIVASDFVVLPYRHIWSSGVAARAMMFNKRIVCSRLPSLEDQLADAEVIWFDEPQELGELFRTLSTM